MMKVLLVLVLLCGAAVAQDAKVIQLTEAESNAAHRAYLDFKEAEKRFLEVKDAVERRYLSQNSAAFVRKEGWECGAVFSEDFKTIVPKSCTDEEREQLRNRDGQFGKLSFQIAAGVWKNR